VKQEVIARQFYVQGHPGMLKMEILKGIYFRDILLVKNSRGANNCE